MRKVVLFILSCLFLPLLTQAGTLRFIVIDAITGQALPMSQVDIRGSGYNFAGKTGPSGNIMFPTMDSDRILVTVSADGYKTKSGELELNYTIEDAYYCEIDLLPNYAPGVADKHQYVKFSIDHAEYELTSKDYACKITSLTVPGKEYLGFSHSLPPGKYRVEMTGPEICDVKYDFEVPLAIPQIILAATPKIAAKTFTTSGTIAPFEEKAEYAKRETFLRSRDFTTIITTIDQPWYLEMEFLFEGKGHIYAVMLKPDEQGAGISLGSCISGTPKEGAPPRQVKWLTCPLQVERGNLVMRTGVNREDVEIDHAAGEDSAKIKYPGGSFSARFTLHPFPLKRKNVEKNIFLYVAPPEKKPNEIK